MQHRALGRRLSTMSISQSRRRPAARTTNLVRWSVTVLWIGLAVTAVVTGERGGRFDDLRQDLASGAVTQVTVRGAGVPDGAHGQATQTVVWRDRWTIVRQDQVRVSVDRAQGASDGSFSGTVLDGESDLGAYLRRSYPGLTVVQENTGGSSTSALGFRDVPAFVGVGLLITTLAVLLLIITTAAPWRLTPWAWLWVWLLLSPVAVPLYLLFAGPTPLVPRPRDVDRRLTGGWALLLCLLIQPVAAAVT